MELQIKFVAPSTRRKPSEKWGANVSLTSDEPAGELQIWSVMKSTRVLLRGATAWKK
jgi:hypothetical protein